MHGTTKTTTVVVSRTTTTTHGDRETMYTHRERERAIYIHTETLVRHSNNSQSCKHTHRQWVSDTRPLAVEPMMPAPRCAQQCNHTRCQTWPPAQLKTISRSPYDNAKVTTDLRRRLIYKTSYKNARLFLGMTYLQNCKIIWDSVRKLAYNISERNFRTFWVTIISPSYEELEIILCNIVRCFVNWVSDTRLLPSAGQKINTGVECGDAGRLQDD